MLIGISYWAMVAVMLAAAAIVGGIVMHSADVNRYMSIATAMDIWVIAATACFTLGLAWYAFTEK